MDEQGKVEQQGEIAQRLGPAIESCIDKVSDFLPWIVVWIWHGIPTWHSDAWQDPRPFRPPIDVRDTPQRQCANPSTELQTFDGNNGILSRGL